MKEFQRITKLRNRVIIMAVIIFVLFAGYYFAYSSIQKMKSEAATLSISADEAESKQQGMALLQKQSAEQAPSRAKIQSFFLQPGSEAVFISSIESLADSASLDHQIESVTYQDDGLPAGFQNLHLKVSTKGGWQSTYQFLSLLENAPYRLEIETVDLASSANNPGQVSTTTSNAIRGNGSLWQAVFSIKVTSFK